MWIIFSICAALFSGLTSIFAKVGIKNIDSTLCSALRTTVIMIFSIIVVFFTGSFNEIYSLDSKEILYLVLSGITTLLLWLSYFKALELSDVTKVTPIDKTSIVLTLILSNIFLNEEITILKVISIVLILFGTVMMIGKLKKQVNNKWIIYAILTALFTSTATILGKIGLNNIESNFASMFRTIIVFILIWIINIFKKSISKIKLIRKRSIIFIILSGVTTSISWLCYFKALQEGEASIVFTIEKLSIVFSVILSWIFLSEKVTLKSCLGLIIIISGTLLLIL